MPASSPTAAAGAAMRSEEGNGGDLGGVRGERREDGGARVLIGGDSLSLVSLSRASLSFSFLFFSFFLSLEREEEEREK